VTNELGKKITMTIMGLLESQSQYFPERTVDNLSTPVMAGRHLPDFLADQLPSESKTW
jgi:hypothetical protein